jgi:hypothetical protein
VEGEGDDFLCGVGVGFLFGDAVGVECLVEGAVIAEDEVGVDPLSVELERWVVVAGVFAVVVVGFGYGCLSDYLEGDDSAVCALSKL